MGRTPMHRRQPGIGRIRQGTKGSQRRRPLGTDSPLGPGNAVRKQGIHKPINCAGHFAQHEPPGKPIRQHIRGKLHENVQIRGGAHTRIPRLRRRIPKHRNTYQKYKGFTPIHTYKPYEPKDRVSAKTLHYHIPTDFCRPPVSPLFILRWRHAFSRVPEFQD